MRRLHMVAALASASLACFIVFACGGSDPHPAAATGDREGGASFDANFSSDGSGDADANGPDGASLPQSCVNTIKDGLETDVDCGGTVCLPCVDGKTCVKSSDCAGKACTNTVCETATCHDGTANNDESDVDCGGAVCAKCTFGKRCNAASDCQSATCANNLCKCPTGMVEVAKATGGAYCVDASEITKGQYNKFVTANVSVNDQIPLCRPPANVTFIPRGAWPPATAPGGLDFNMSLPIHYVDWCDAYSYCKWANKQLCGKINGGGNDPANYADATQSAWYNACSAQGTKGWPYGTSYLADHCNGTGDGILGGPNGYGYGDGGINPDVNDDLGVYEVVNGDSFGNFTTYANTGCQGGSVGLYQMSGNVAEWEDSCDQGDASVASCRLRGGSYAAAGVSTTVRCDANRTEQRLPPVGSGTDPLKDVGFRCCIY